LDQQSKRPACAARSASNHPLQIPNLPIRNASASWRLMTKCARLSTSFERVGFHDYTRGSHGSISFFASIFPKTLRTFVGLVGCADSERSAVPTTKKVDTTPVEPSNRAHFEDGIFDLTYYVVTQPNSIYVGCPFESGEALLQTRYNRNRTPCKNGFSIGTGGRDDLTRIELGDKSAYFTTRGAFERASSLPDPFVVAAKTSGVGFASLLSGRQYRITPTFKHIHVIGDPGAPDNDPPALAEELRRKYPSIDPSRIIVGEPVDLDCKIQRRTRENFLGRQVEFDIGVCSFTPVNE